MILLVIWHSYWNLYTQPCNTKKPSHKENIQGFLQKFNITDPGVALVILLLTRFSTFVSVHSSKTQFSWLGLFFLLSMIQIIHHNYIYTVWFACKWLRQLKLKKKEKKDDIISFFVELWKNVTRFFFSLSPSLTSVSVFILLPIKSFYMGKIWLPITKEVYFTNSKPRRSSIC